MSTKVVMEALSPTMEEGKVLSWLKAEGDDVMTGDVIAEVETDKAVMELQARGDGVLRKVLVPEGATVEVGALVAVIAQPDEDIEDLVSRAQPLAAPGQAEIAQPQPTAAPAIAPTTSPAASAEAAVTRVAPTVPARVVAAPAEIRASPLARRLARERGIDLALIAGSGPGGRVVKRDVELASAAAPALPIAPPPGGVGVGGYRDVPLSQMRKTIARRLAQSIGPVPHFYLTAEIDMERAAEARAELNGLEEGQRISFNDIIVKVVAAALMHHRSCNAWWQEDHIRYFDEVHMGIAVAVEEGLITPVIRDAHVKSLRDIARESRDLADRARARRLTPEEYTGATFTVSNLGMFGIDQFTAVINPPEAGSLAVGSITEKPVVRDGAVSARRRMRVTMSCDHRVIDGATGARFLETVRHMLENPLAIVW
ncbi:MAG: dihydrolipoamide acetyltransferase family protein [Gemmatimonadales bacterium]